MKTILAFGDSLTWGFNPTDATRHAPEDRWPHALAAASGHTVIAEGLNGRTTAYDDHTAPVDRNGARLLPTLLTSHAPLDLVAIMLGTNDLKLFLCGSADGAARGIARLIQIVQHHPYPGGGAVPRVLVIAPPPFVPPTATERAAEEIAQSQRFAPLFAAEAETAGAAFFDAGTVATCSPLDGIHLDAANTRAIGTALAPVVARLL